MAWLGIMEGARSVAFWAWQPPDEKMMDFAHRTDGKPVEIAPQWVVLRYANAAVAIRPLKCRILDTTDDDPNPQRRQTGRIVDLPLRIEKTDRGDLLSLPLVEGHTGLITQPLFFSGWCVVLLDSPDDVDGLSLVETFCEDGEVPRTGGELIRSVDLSTSFTRLKLVRDMLTGDVERFIDGRRHDGPT
jgi:hypothetical protein